MTSATGFVSCVFLIALLILIFEGSLSNEIVTTKLNSIDGFLWHQDRAPHVNMKRHQRLMISYAVMKLLISLLTIK